MDDVARRLPTDLAVPCGCGRAVPLLLFVVDGRPHDSAVCPHCERTCFLSPPPRVDGRSRRAVA